MFSHLSHWSQSILARLSALLPSCCALCGSSGNEAICDGCNAQFFGQKRHRCTCCAIPLPEREGTTVCGECLKHGPAFDATIVAADYAALVDQLVLALKFGNRLELASLFARMMHDALRTQAQSLPIQLTAVPLGPQRLVERGFNQALEIAKPLSRLLGINLDASLVARQRDTRAQALLHPDERHQNIRNAFLISVDAMDRIRGQHVGVVDDVMTTGETLNELAATLKRFGAARVTNIVFARTFQK